MPQKKHRVIIASGRHDLASLIPALEEEGYEVLACDEGARALELALARPPVLMVVETALPLLPTERLVQILRANPRTERIAFCFIGREGEEVEGFRRHRDQFFVRPFNREQLLGDVLGYLHRLERTRRVGRQEREVEGALEQISLVDLLQIFSLNRKDGLLTLRRSDGLTGTISLLGGLVTNARLGQMQGEKAFFRLLGWNEGSFSFVPGGRDEAPRITLPTDHLIMEGLRQQDELAALRDKLPAAGDELVLKVPRDRLPPGLRPATQEILLLLQYYRRVRDILDHSSRPDLEVLQILQVLLDKGILELAPVPEGEPGEEESLLASEEVIAIKEAFGEGDSLFEAASVKLVLLPAARADLDAFIGCLQGVREFEPDAGLLHSAGVFPLGDVGRLKVADSFAIRLFCLPTTPDAVPLWRPFCRRLLGVLVLGEGEHLTAAEEFFRLNSRTPVIPLAGSSKRPGCIPLAPGDRLGLKQLLSALAEPYRRPAELDMVPLDDGRPD